MSRSITARLIRPILLSALLLVAALALVRVPLPTVRASVGVQPVRQGRGVGEGPNRAGLVVRFDDGRTERMCVSFSETEISGDELLSRSGLSDVIFNDQGALCRIDGQGCEPDNCFCQCTNPNECTYWAHYIREGGAWSYSQLGAMSTTVQNGGLQGWSWGDGDFTQGVPPPDTTFEEVCPATVVPVPTINAAACRAVLWLHGQQKEDGGFGNTSKSSAAVTADTTYVLGLLSEDVTGPRWTNATGKNPLSALQTLAIPGFAQADPGQAGKVARAVALAGGDPRAFGGLDLVATIEGFYDPATGLYHPNFIFRHSLAIEGLWRSDAPVPTAAYDALLAAQLADGGWFWSQGAPQSDVDTTGRVLYVLGRIGQIQATSVYEKAADFLVGQQLPTGGWNVGYSTDPANANSTALANGGLLATGYDPQSAIFTQQGKGALETLLSFQEPSGAFRYIREAGKEESRIMATIDALAALAPLVETPICQSTYLPAIMMR